MNENIQNTNKNNNNNSAGGKNIKDGQNNPLTNRQVNSISDENGNEEDDEK